LSTIPEQRVCTTISLSDGSQVPIARTNSNFQFSAFAAATDTSSPRGKHESELWQLASILFDDVREELPVGLSADAADLYQIRLRKEKLSQFWRKLVQADVDTQLFTAKSHEEKALLHLTGGNIPEACASLLAGSNFHLAQMVSQIGGDKVFRETMAKQLDDWSELNVSSEINDCIRTIYELLAGRTLDCRGKSGSGSENKVPSFKFSDRFKLDWKRAFGLRLWYGTLQVDDVASAVLQFTADLDDNGEPAKPLPWFVLAREDMGWDDPNPESREDPLWGLLKFYADRYCDDVEAEDIVATLGNLFQPENTSGNPQDPRLSFQLINLLRGKVLAISDNDLATAPTSTPVADELAMKLAAALEPQIPTKPEVLVVTSWVLLHITDTATRTSLLKTQLDHYAKLLVDNEAISAALSHAPSSLDTSTGSLRIPFAWLCAAKATYARTVVHDSVAEAHWLLEGREVNAAHDVLCRVIGPAAVVEGEWDDVRVVLAALTETEMVGGVADWEKGGGLYADYVELVDLTDGAASGKRQGQDAKTVVKRLVRKMSGSLEALAAEGVAHKSPMEKIALKIMAAKVLEIGNREGVSLTCLMACCFDFKTNFGPGIGARASLEVTT
jgi:nuclear pore complex protein Nup98-Nup96